jgi:hypothetical protein
MKAAASVARTSAASEDVIDRERRRGRLLGLGELCVSTGLLGTMHVVTRTELNSLAAARPGGGGWGGVLLPCTACTRDAITQAITLHTCLQLCFFQ